MYANNFFRVFDLLKYEGYDKTTLIIQCLICKTILGTGQTGDKR